MEKILVATDLSASSIPAVYFAYKLSQLKEATLVIVHIYHILKPKNWRAQRFENYQKVRREFILTKLNKFLDRIFTTIEAPGINFEIDLQMSPNTVTSILRCCAKHKCTSMCIGTLGAGKSPGTIGTVARKLIAKAQVPIFSMPTIYKAKTVNRICYVSDMANYQKEINKMLEFIQLLSTDISMLHIVSPAEILPKPTVLEARLLKRTGVVIKIKYAPRNLINTLMEDIDAAIKKIRPSLVVFFINRSKYDLNPMLITSDIQPLSLFRKIPILTFKK